MNDRSTPCWLLTGLLGCAGPATFAPQPVPDPAAPQTPIEQPEDLIDEVAAGDHATCIRTVQGRIACWGDVVGFGGYAEPIALPMPPAMRLVGDESTWCALTRDEGEVWCWGDDEAGALGRTTAPRGFDLRPGPVPAVQDAIDLVRRGGLTCARTEAGVTWCWGKGAVPTRLKPRTPSIPLALVAQARLCADNPYACDEEPTPDASIELPGDGGSSLGECTAQSGGELHCQRRRFRAESTLFVAQADSLSLGPEHACAVALDGLPWCLGDDEHGQTGGAELVGPVRSVSVGRAHSCALTDHRRVMCWGSNEHGQLGRPAPAHHVDTPTLASLHGEATALVRFGEDICAQTDSGVSCPSQRCERTGFEPTEYPRFAEGPHGTTCLFNPSGSRSCANRATFLREDSPTGRGELEAVLRRPDSRRWCISKGRISTCEGTEQIVTDGSLSGVSTDYDAGCGLTSAGALRCFMGRPYAQHAFPGPFEAVSMPEKLVRRKDGQTLQIDTRAAKLRPMPVADLVHVSSDGMNRTCGIDARGRAWCWWFRDPEPRRFEAPVAFTQIEPTTDHTCAIADDGTLWCWGDNDRSQLGHGDPRCVRDPVDVTDAILRALEDEEPGR